MKLSKERATAAEKQQFESEYEPLILKELSTNPRDGVAAISKRIGLPYSTTQYWIKKLEQKYGIHYTIEHWFLRNLGFDRYIAIAKFNDRRPNAEELKKEVEKNPYIQLAVMTRGAYDLFLFLVAPDIRFAEDTIYNLRSSSVFANCPGIWYSSYYQQGIGYIMLRDSFFDILKEKIWQRTKETPRKQKDQLFLREYATLKELNNNGLIEFSKIDEKYKLKEGSAQYTYHKLIAEDMIKRVTITMDNPPIKDIGIIIAEQLDVNKFNAHKKDYYIETLSESEAPLNKYIFAGDIGSPYGIILIATTYEDGDMEKIEESLMKNMHGCALRTSIVSNILTGNFGFRKIDTTKTWIYDKLLEK
jgi:DNA-binding Lrp family transcriptional regulator